MTEWSLEFQQVTLKPVTTPLLPTTEPPTSTQSCKEANEGELKSNSLRQETDRNNPPGFAELKPEGEGETKASKRVRSTYKHPMHGEGTATTAFQYFPMSGSICYVSNHLDGKPNHGMETMLRSNLDFTCIINYTM